LLSRESEVHLAQVQEAVRRSVAEVLDSHRTGAVAASAYDERAEALIPIPFAPGKGPTASDRLARGAVPTPGQTNHWPRFVLLANGHVGEREGGPGTSSYKDLEGGVSRLNQPLHGTI
jgi:hypothetical protein